MIPTGNEKENNILSLSKNSADMSLGSREINCSGRLTNFNIKVDNNLI